MSTQSPPILYRQGRSLSHTLSYAMISIARFNSSPHCFGKEASNIKIAVVGNLRGCPVELLHFLSFSLTVHTKAECSSWPSTSPRTIPLNHQRLASPRSAGSVFARRKNKRTDERTLRYYYWWLCSLLRLPSPQRSTTRTSTAMVAYAWTF